MYLQRAAVRPRLRSAAFALGGDYVSSFKWDSQPERLISRPVCGGDLGCHRRLCSCRQGCQRSLFLAHVGAWSPGESADGASFLGVCAPPPAPHFWRPAFWLSHFRAVVTIHVRGLPCWAQTADQKQCRHLGFLRPPCVPSPFQTCLLLHAPRLGGACLPATLRLAPS